ncbi:hypothetical protein D3C78_1312800 [compost metagenome]
MTLDSVATTLPEMSFRRPAASSLMRAKLSWVATSCCSMRAICCWLHSASPPRASSKAPTNMPSSRLEPLRGATAAGAAARSRGSGGSSAGKALSRRSEVRLGRSSSSSRESLRMPSQPVSEPVCPGSLRSIPAGPWGRPGALPRCSVHCNEACPALRPAAARAVRTAIAGMRLALPASTHAALRLHQGETPWN